MARAGTIARHAPIAAPPYERASGKGSKKSDCGKGEGWSKKGKVKGYSNKKETVKKAVEGAIADISSAVQDAIHTVQSQQAPDQRQLPSPFQIALPGAGSDIGGQMVQVPLKDLQLLHASLGRAFFAASNGHRLMEGLAGQFESEGKVIGQAKTIVENILATRNI